MVAFNFKKEFVPHIKSGKKRMTIRQTKRCDVGDDMQLYTGQRTKQCKKIMDAVCSDVFKIYITESGVGCPRFTSMKNLADLDGFKSPVEMREFFKNQYGLPFEGYAHVWG